MTWRLVCLLFATLPQAVWAQGVFDMGTLTGTLSQDAVTKSEEERAARQPAPPPSSEDTEDAKARYNCRVMLPRFRERFGAEDPQVQKLAGLCRRFRP